jgi:hypothetical protein
MQQLCVLPFSGEAGESVSSALTARLWENEFYTLVDRTELRPVQWTAGTTAGESADLAEFLTAARSRGIDGLIVGDVLEYRCDDTVLTDHEFHLGTSQHEDRRRSSESSGMDLGVSTEQRVHREATVSITFRLVDVQSGQVRATRQTGHSFHGEGGNGWNDLPPRGEVLDQLTQRCLDEFVGLLAPHQIELPVSLARGSLFQKGSSLVYRGNDLARRGRWDEAVRVWEQATQTNPAHDAALYNLALAAAAKQQFTEAEQYATRAVNTRHRELYVDGLERIRQQSEDYARTLQQRRDISLTGELD